MPSACNKPGLRQVTHRYVRSAPGARIEGPYRIPKLTVLDGICRAIPLVTPLSCRIDLYEIKARLRRHRDLRAALARRPRSPSAGQVAKAALVRSYVSFDA